MVLILSSFSHSWQGSTSFKNTGIWKNCRPRAYAFVKKICTKPGQINVAIEQKGQVPTIPSSGLAKVWSWLKIFQCNLFFCSEKCGFTTTEAVPEHIGLSRKQPARLPPPPAHTAHPRLARLLHLLLPRSSSGLEVQVPRFPQQVAGK